MSRVQTLMVLTLALTKQAVTHTWIEQLTNIASNGTFVAGYGYARGFVDREPGFDQNANLWQLPTQSAFVDATNLLCHPSQRSAFQSPKYPRLQATLGSMVALRYAENGHATIPGGGNGLSRKPEHGGTVFVFGTQTPIQDETLLNVLAWTRDRSGGDRRGILLTAQNFDDGRCYQLGNGAALANSRKAENPNQIIGQPGSEHEILCETDVRLPENLDLNTPYTLYWVWQWPTAPMKDPTYPNGKDANGAALNGKDEYYTSCIDIDIVVNVQSKQIDNPLNQQDPVPTAVQNFQSREALTLDPLALYSDPAFGTSRIASATLGNAPFNTHVV